jgi:hypothetical protein
MQETSKCEVKFIAANKDPLIWVKRADFDRQNPGYSWRKNIIT